MCDRIWRDITRENCKDYELDSWVVVIARECGYTIHETLNSKCIFMKYGYIAYECDIYDTNTIEYIANML